jgi:hypothetical protein
MSVYLSKNDVDDTEEYYIYQSYSVPPDDCVFLSKKDLIDLKRQIEEMLCQHI